MTLLLEHETEKLVAVFEGSRKRAHMTGYDLQSLVFDLGSWIRYLIMLRTGKPALMTTYRGQSPQQMKVCRMGSISDEATFDSI